MSDDRRHGPHTSRRIDDALDWWIETVERDMAKMVVKIENLEKLCNDDRLDRRYVPRAEQEHRYERSRDWGLRLLMVAVAVGQAVEAVLIARGGH